MSTSKQQREQERQQAIERLRALIQPGDTVYTVLRHVSRSGMQRQLSVYAIGEDRRPIYLTAYVARAIGAPLKRGYNDTITRNGCGYDAGHDTVHHLAYVLFGDGGALRQEWI